MIYKNTQFNSFIVKVMVLSIIIMSVATLPDINGLEWLAIILLLLLTCLFTTMTIVVNESHIEWFFGPKFWRKTQELKDVVSVKESPANWYHGFGMRLRSNGWLYRVSGASFVELFLNNGTTIALGTNESVKLLDSINRIIDNSDVKTA